jgi:hypothetical protein
MKPVVKLHGKSCKVIESKRKVSWLLSKTKTTHFSVNTLSGCSTSQGADFSISLPSLHQECRSSFKGPRLVPEVQYISSELTKPSCPCSKSFSVDCICFIDWTSRSPFSASKKHFNSPDDFHAAGFIPYWQHLEYASAKVYWNMVV